MAFKRSAVRSRLSPPRDLEREFRVFFFFAARAKAACKKQTAAPAQPRPFLPQAAGSGCAVPHAREAIRNGFEKVALPYSNQTGYGRAFLACLFSPALQAPRLRGAAKLTGKSRAACAHMGNASGAD